MAQRDIKAEQDEFAPGTSVDMTGDVKTLVNLDPEAKQVEEISVSGAGNNTTIEVKFTIDGDVVIVSFDTDSDATIDETVNGLADAINNERKVSGRVVAEADTGADTITVTSRYAGLGFTLEEESDPNSNISISNTTQNADASTVPFGRAVERHGDPARSDGHALGRLLDASNLTARELRVNVSSAQNSTEYTVVLIIRGETYEATFTSDASATVDEVVNGLQSAIDGLTDVVTANADTGNDRIEVVPETAGFADFDIIDVSPTADLSFTEHQDGDDVREKFAGITLAGGGRLIKPGTTGAEYEPNQHMNVKNEGRVAVATEEEISEGDYVWVRLSANGDLDEVGGFRASFNSGAVPMPKDMLEWDRAPKENLATLEIK